MNLHIKGKQALIGGASRGLGFGCAFNLAREGVNVAIVARTQKDIEKAGETIRKETGVHVIAIAQDITTEKGRQAIYEQLPHVDILITNAGGPPPGKDFRQWDDAIWQQALNDNMLTPINLIKFYVDTMIAKQFGRIINITSGAVKMPIPNLGLSNGARSGLTGFIAGLARDKNLLRHNVTINNLLPGNFDTIRIKQTLETLAQEKNISLEQMCEERANNIPAGRLGTIDEFGQYCAFICSQQASYISGQNLLIDGGMNPSTF